MRRRLSAAATAAAAVALLLALSGCRAGSAVSTPVPVPTDVDLTEVDPDAPGNGIWYLTGTAALDQVVEATRQARSATMTGTLVELVTVDPQQAPIPGRTITIDVRGSATSATATIVAGGQRVELVLVDGAAFVRGDAAAAAAAGVPELAEGFVCTSPDDALVTRWATLLTPAALLDDAIGGLELSVTPPADADAETTELVVGAGNAPVGTLIVSTVGRPLPSRLVAADTTGTIDVTFADWAEPVEVTAPTELSVPCG